MKLTVNKYYFILNPGFLLLMIFLFIFSGESMAQKSKKSKKKKPELEVNIDIGTTYDDNILKYSDKYLEKFMNQEDEGRFHIETYDDLILLTSIGLTSTHRFFKKNKTVFNAGFSRRTYLVNSIKNWNSFSVGVRQYLPGRISFKFLYSYIPDFYVRHFRDDVWVDIYGYDDPRTFTPYVFSKDNYGFYIQKYFFKNTRIKFSTYYAPYYHNKHYTEYDSKNWTNGVDIYQYLFKNLRLDLGYDYTTSDAKGYDAAYETAEDNNGPDATYEEDKFSFGLYWKLPRLKKKSQSLNASCQIINRYYLSEFPVEVDWLHVGRVDNNIRLFFDYKIKLSKSISLTAYYNWLFRDTRTTSPYNSEGVSDEKDYEQNIYGLEFSYSFDIFK